LGESPRQNLHPKINGESGRGGKDQLFKGSEITGKDPFICSDRENFSGRSGTPNERSTVVIRRGRLYTEGEICSVQ